MNKSGDIFFPGSKDPYRPINPWGREAKVTDHRGNEIDWKNPLDVETFQIHVDTREGTIPVGPKAARAIVSEWLSLISLAIKSGKITGWSNPHLVKAPRQRAVARLF